MPNELKPFRSRIRWNGEMSLFSTRANINELMKFCNLLAEKVDALIAENNRLSRIVEQESKR